MSPWEEAVAWDAIRHNEPLPEILLKRKNHPKRKPQRRGGGKKKEKPREDGEK